MRRLSVPCYPRIRGADGQERYCSLERIEREHNAELLGEVVDFYAARAQHPNGRRGNGLLANGFCAWGVGRLGALVRPLPFPELVEPVTWKNNPTPLLPVLRVGETPKLDHFVDDLIRRAIRYPFARVNCGWDANALVWLGRERWPEYRRPYPFLDIDNGRDNFDGEDDHEEDER